MNIQMLTSRQQTHFCMHILHSTSLFLTSRCFLCFLCESLPGQLFLTFSSLCFFLFSPSCSSFHLNFSLHGPAQCALLTLTPQSQCPSPTSAHTNQSASTPGPTFTLLALSSTLTLRMKTNMTGGWSRALVPWPSPMISPLRLKLEVTLHGG